MKRIGVVGLCFLIGTFAAAALGAATMTEGLSKTSVGRFGWNTSGEKTIDDGVMIQTITPEGITSCVPSGISFNNTRFWKLKISTKADEAGNLLDLPVRFYFAIDPDDAGLQNGWQQKDYPDETKWKMLRTGATWESQGIKTPNPKASPEDTMWQYNGYGWYRQHFTLPETWKKDRIFLYVGAIDDYDWIYVNGHLIGKTGEETPNFYIVARKYEIKPEYLDFSGPNTIAVRVFDVHGAGGIVKGPVQLVRGEKALQALTDTESGSAARVKWLNWVAKELEVRSNRGTYNLTYSLLSPGVLIESPDQALGLESSDGIDFLAAETDGAPRVTAVSSGFALDRKLTANWLLLWSKAESEDRVVPFLVVLEKRPDKVEITGRQVKFTRQSGVGKVIVSTPLGIAYPLGREVAGWSSGLPKDVEQKCRFWSAALLDYPVNQKEYYTYDPAQAKVVIRQKTEYQVIRDEWQTPERKTAVLSPFLSFSRANNYPVSVTEKMQDLGCPTLYGRLEGTAGDEINFTLPVPPIDLALAIPPDSGQSEYRKLLEGIGAFYLGDYRYRLEEYLPTGRDFLAEKIENGKNQLDAGRRNSILNFEVPVNVAGGYGQCKDLGVINWYAPDVRQKLLDYEGFSLFQQLKHFDDAWEKTKEPTTGAEYYFNRAFISPDNTRQNGKRPYDMDSAASGYLGAVYQYVLFSGNWALVRENWLTFQKIMSTFDVVDDWLLMSSSSEDNGGGINCVDCTWDDWPGQDAMVAMAQYLKDWPVRDKFQYLRARQNVVTVMKTGFEHAYLKQYMPVEENMFFTGLEENKADGGYPYKRMLVSNETGLPWIFNNANLTLPVSPLTNQARFAPELLTATLARTEKTVPDWNRGDLLVEGKVFQGFSGRMNLNPNLHMVQNQILLRYFLNKPGDDQPLRDFAKICTRQVFQPQNLLWVPFSLSQELISLMATARDPLRLSNWAPYRLADAVYHRTGRTVQLKFAAVNDDPLELTAFCRERPAAVSIGGQALKEQSGRTAAEGAPSRKATAAEGWFYDAKDSSLLVRVRHAAEIPLTVRFSHEFPATPDMLKDDGGFYRASGGNLLANPGFETRTGLQRIYASGFENRDVLINFWNSVQNEINKGSDSFSQNKVGVESQVVRSGKAAAYLEPSLNKGWLTPEVVSGVFQDVMARPNTRYLATFYYCAPDIKPEEATLTFAVSAAERKPELRLRGSSYIRAEEILLTKDNFQCDQVKVGSVVIPKDKLVSRDWQKVVVPIETPANTVVVRVGVSLKADKENAQGRVYLDDVSLEPAP